MRHSFSSTLAAAALFAASAFTGSAQAETLRSINAFADTIPQIPGLYYPFQEAVTKATGGEITFQNNGPETAPPFEQFEPLSQGVFDITYTVPGYHQAETGVGVALSAIPETSNSDLLTSSGIREWVTDYYRKNFNVIPIAIYPIGKTVFVLREPLTGDTRLDGRKIRSNASYEGIVRAMGAAPVSMGPADAYAALEKGTLDGVVWPEVATAQFKLFEVTKYLAQPAFGESHNAVYMNASKFDSLTEEQQNAILQAGIEMEKNAKVFFDKLTEEQNKEMLENGAEFTEFNPEVAAQLDELYVLGMKDIGMRSRPDDVKALLELSGN